MAQKKTTVLIINGAENGAHSRGNYNRGLAEAAIETLTPYFNVLTTEVADDYEVETEIEKFKEADVVIYQYPVFWFMVPSSLKKYMDDVFSHGEFFNYTKGPYGTGGLMRSKKVMLSTTWNAPKEAFNDTKAFFDGMTPDEAILAMRKAHQYCGFTELPHFSCHNVVREPRFDENKHRFITHLSQVFDLKLATEAA